MGVGWPEWILKMEEFERRHLAKWYFWLRRWELGRSEGVKWNWEDDLSRCVWMWMSVRLDWDPGSMLLGETEPWCQWH